MIVAEGYASARVIGHIDCGAPSIEVRTGVDVRLDTVASLAAVPEDSSKINMSTIAHMLAVGFDCTMVALAESAILVYILYIVNEQEEKAVNLAGTYTLRNLINRLYAG